MDGMSRPLRIEFPGAIYHVFARGVAGLPVFLDDQDRVLFLREVERQVQSGTLIDHTHSLMDTHVHFLLETPQAGLGRWMKEILGNYAQIFNRRHVRSGHLWQGPYKAILVQDGGYLLTCSQYIHLNPYRAGLERELGSYGWSSYYNFTRGDGFVTWVHTGRILSYFNGREEYRKFVEAGKDRQLIDPFRLAVAGIALGDEAFVERIRQMARNKPLSPEIPSQSALFRSSRSPSLEEIRAQVSLTFAGLSACQQRRALVWALYANTWMKGYEIAGTVGLSPTAARNAAVGMELHRRSAPGLAERFALLQRELGQPDAGHIARITRGL